MCDREWRARDRERRTCERKAAARAIEHLSRRRALALAARTGAAAVFGAGLLSTVGACARGAGEDRLVVYAAGPRRLAESIVAAFRDAFAVEVDLFTATTGQILAKVEAERLNPRADVLLLASGLAAEWMRREGRLASLDLDPPAWSGHAERQGWTDPNGMFIATGAACVGIAARRGWEHGTDSWSGMLDGSFTDAQGRPGRVVMPSPSRSGTSGDFVVQWTLEEGARAWSLLVQARRAGRLEVKGANSEALGSLRTGESQAILAAVDYLICDDLAKGAPFTLRFPSAGAPIVTRPVCVLRTSRRVEAARRFVQFCVGTEAQRLVAASNMLPADPSIPLSSIRAEAGVPTPMPLPLDQALAEQRPILRRFQYEVERLVVIS